MEKLFICNGNKWDCLKTNCYKCGGPCYSTTDKKSSLSIEESPFETNEKYVFGQEIVNITYHNIDWLKCFYTIPTEIMRNDKHGTRN